MKLQGRNLILGMQGNDVRELQRDLARLGFDILLQESTDGRFGATTHAAVHLLHRQNGGGPDGVVDIKTVEAINGKLGALPRVVRGNLRQADGKPLARARVVAFDKDLRTETEVGKATCDLAGYFEISYAFRAPDRVAPNLVVKGFAGARTTKPVAVSAVMFDANPEVIINLVAGESQYRGPSEFEVLLKDIAPVVDRQRVKIAGLVENEETRDVSFLSGQTRHTADRVAHAVLSHRHAEKNKLVKPEAFYAFLRQGLPTEPSALLSQDPDTLRRALVQAVADNVIPRGFETEARLKATLEGLQAWRAGVALEDPPDPAQITLGTLVKGVLTDSPKQKRFMRVYAAHSGPIADFWKQLERDAQLAPHAAELEFAVRVGNLGRNHMPLWEAVRSTPGLNDVKALAALNEDGWHALITEHGVGTPNDVGGSDDEARAREYARSLAHAVEAAVPTEFFVARLKEIDVPGKRDLLTFFQANPSFDIKDTRLDAYLKANPGALNQLEDKTAAVKQLQGLQRVYRLAPAFQPAMALHQAGRDSAQTISRMGRNAFVGRFGRHFIDGTQAKATYAKAQHVSAAAIALIGDVHPAMSQVATRAVPGTLAKPVADLPQWSALFESLEFCSCDHCQSVLGPAAYFVDLLNFLEHRDAKPAALDPLPDPPPVRPSVKDILFVRRPDLGDIELTCENTNTVLPYVDLVAEVLEDAVAPPPAFSRFELDSTRIPDLDKGLVSPDLNADFSGSLDHPSIRVKRPGDWWVVDDLSFSYSVRTQPSGKPRVESRGRQSGRTSDPAANPQYVNPRAYATLREAVFPWSLPFDQSLEEVRAYLGHIGVPRHQIMEAFLPGERSTILSAPRLAAEYLGVTPKEVRLISGADPATLAEQWGFAGNQLDFETLLTEGRVDKVLRRSGLEYRQLLDLLQLRYVNPGNSLRLVSSDPDHPDTCDTTKLSVQGLNADAASRILRFVRLWRRVGWTMFDLDRAIAALGGDLTDGFLVQLSHLSRLRTRFNLPVTRLSAFWAPLDSVRYTNHGDTSKPVVPSLYEQLFRSRATINPLDAAFTEDPAALTGRLTDHAEALAAALAVSATDLDAIVRCAKVFPQNIEIALDLANLSQLYRHVTLAKALRLRVQDYVRGLELIDDAPFSDTTRTVLFVERAADVRDSGFSFAELDYLLRHQSEASSGIAFEESAIGDYLKDLALELQKGAAKEAIARKLAETFHFEMRTVSLLEPQWASLMELTLPDTKVELTRVEFPNQFADVLRLHKISVIAAHFNMTAGMLEWLLSVGKAQGLLDLTTLPSAPTIAAFDKWMRLVGLLSLRRAFFDGEHGLLDLLGLAHATPAGTREELLSKLVEQTNWNGADVELLAGPDGFGLTVPADLEHEKALLRLRDCFVVLMRLGISAAQAKTLSTADDMTDVARAVKQAARAKYDDGQWSRIAKPLRDVLREKQRSALVDHLIATRPEMGWEDANDLYAHFLIDVEMAPCMMTSRIKQAISSVQLFVQRCLMNLETDVLASFETDDAWDWWKWMKNYRVWEANRKVFLYPENWIEPELRDDKSPFFKELESELMESDLTLETAETAFLNYVEKLDHVARLEVMGVYHQKEIELDVLHVFARTQAPPHVYYYRQRVNAAYWTPWEKVDLDIEGNHLVPVLWNGRLFLFWAMFMEKADSVGVTLPPLGEGGVISDGTIRYWDVKLAWSERKQGQWTGKKVSSTSAQIHRGSKELPELSRVFFVPIIEGSDLTIDQLFVTTGGRRSERAITPPVGPGGNPLPDISDPPVLNPDVDGISPIKSDQNRFFFGGCYVDPQVTPLPSTSMTGQRPALLGTERTYMSFQEVGDTGLNLPGRRDLDNAQAALVRTPGQYRVTSQGAESRVTGIPFLFQDPFRSYLVVPQSSRRDDVSIDPGEIGGVKTMRRPGPAFTSPLAVHDLAAITLGPDTHVIAPFALRPNTKYSFHPLYHPYVCAFLYVLNRQGLDQMLRREVQLEPHRFLPDGQSISTFSFADAYKPSTNLVGQPYPIEEVDFGSSGSYSSYNWELFFHAPLLIADRLTKNQRFEEATRWFHYIFNPTDISKESPPQRYWQTREFFEKTSEDYQEGRLDHLFTLLARAGDLRQKLTLTPEEQKDLQRVNDLEASIAAWREDPFKPHLVARMRTTANQKAVVMKYIDNLVAWGDHLFRRDTLETLNEATQLYVMAAEILGPRPIEVPPRITPRVQTYNSLEVSLDAFSNALVELEELIPVDTEPGASMPEQQPPSMLYFGLPKNDKLLRYWDTVADRLFKVRHCMNIEGVVRHLPLFEPALDPGLLVRGVAAGLDLNSLLNEADTTRPGYRFHVMAQKATELCGELRSLGATLLATLEKRDAEQLSLLRAKHETGMVELIEQVREKQLEEAEASLVALQKSRELVVSRYLHYQALLGVENPQTPAVDQVVPEIAASQLARVSVSDGVRQIAHETAEAALLEAAGRERGKATAASLAAAFFAPLPDTNIQPLGVGGSFVLHRLPSLFALCYGAEADNSSVRAGRSSRNAQYVMRAHEWTLQHNLAAREIMQIDKQAIAAEIRKEIARLELRNHRRQMSNAHEVEEFMRDKYTSQELYSWMVGQMSGVYFQAYQLAYETARRTEQCFRHELGITSSNFIQFGYWDSLKKGLMAGEKLHHDLKRLEIAYLDGNIREYELTKHVSLVSLDPEEFLKLKEEGACDFDIPEWLFDLDTPGHYMRRLKNVSLTVPCVAGPYMSNHCKLTLENSSYRRTAVLHPGTDPAERYGRDETNGADERFVDIKSGAEAIVTSTGQNDAGLFEPSMRDERYLPFEGAGATSHWRLELPTAFKAFDYSTISDVILHLRYTARDLNGDGDEFRAAATDSVMSLIAAADAQPLFRLFSLRHEFPSEWRRFVSSPADATMTVDLAATRFPYFVQSREITVRLATVIARTKSGTPVQVDVAPGQAATNLTPSPRTGQDKPGPWTFGTADPKLVEDVFVIFAYSAS